MSDANVIRLFCFGGVVFLGLIVMANYRRIAELNANLKTQAEGIACYTFIVMLPCMFIVFLLILGTTWPNEMDNPRKITTSYGK